MATRFRVKLRDEDLGIFDPDEIEIEHAMMLEDKTGQSLAELMNGVGRLSARSLQALVWFQRIRGGDTNADLHAGFKLGDLDVEDLSDADPTEAAPAAGSGDASDQTTRSGASATSTSAS